VGVIHIYLYLCA